MNKFNIFDNKTVVVTGHTGFKGSWLTVWLKLLGAKVVGISLDIASNPSHYESANISNNITDLRIDLRDRDAIECAIISANPDFVFHLAAQALVRPSYDDPIETWQTNVLGTLHILEALRKIKHHCAAVIITSDKCYDNVEWVWGYRETDAMGGPDPYSASKGAAELAIRSHIKSFFHNDSSKVRIASARAGNVIGGGDWAIDRIVPDCMRAWSKNETVELRNPMATRPWQHVLEPLSGYLNLAMELYKEENLHNEPFNFGPPAHQNHSVGELVTSMSAYWEKVKWDDVSSQYGGPYESGLLKLNCDKALHHLGWRAIWNFEETVRQTVLWYRHYYEKPDVSIVDFTLQQIDEYVTKACAEGIPWSK